MRGLVQILQRCPEENVRKGSSTDLAIAKFDFRSSPESGLKSACIAPCPFRATTRLMHRSKIDAGQSMKSSGRLSLNRPRQYSFELIEKSGLRLDIDCAAMLFHNDVMAHQNPAPFPPPAGLVVKKGLNVFSLISAGMPVPLSRMRISTLSPRFFVATISVGSKPSPISVLRLAVA